MIPLCWKHTGLVKCAGSLGIYLRQYLKGATTGLQPNGDHLLDLIVSVREHNRPGELS